MARPTHARDLARPTHARDLAPQRPWARYSPVPPMGARLTKPHTLRGSATCRMAAWNEWTAAAVTAAETYVIEPLAQTLHAAATPHLEKFPKFFFR